MSQSSNGFTEEEKKAILDSLIDKFVNIILNLGSAPRKEMLDELELVGQLIDRFGGSSQSLRSFWMGE